MLLGGTAVGALLPGMPAFELLSRSSLLRTTVLILIPFVVGLAVMRRGWIAAAAAYVFGVVLWVGFYLRPAPPWAPSDVWFLATWISFILQTAVVAALFGLLGFVGGRVRAIFRGRRND